MHHTDLCLNALIQLKAAQCTLKSFQEFPSSSSDSSRFYPPCQGTWNVLDTRVKWQHPHSAFLLWIGWTALTISFTFCCLSPFSQLLWLQVFGALLLPSCLYLRIAWQCKAQALSFLPLPLTADPLFFPSSKQLLKTLLTWFLKCSFTKRRAVTRQQ